MELQDPVFDAVVQLFAACLDIIFFSWATQHASSLQQSGRAFALRLDKLGELLGLQVQLHTPTWHLGNGTQKERQRGAVCLESRCYSHMVGRGRTPKLLGVLDALRRVLPCKISGRCVESSSERCCNLGGNAEVCPCVGCCSQDYASTLPRCLSVLLGQAGQEVHWVVNQLETQALRLAAGFLVPQANEHEAGGRAVAR